jgi:PAS domain S-box-containing protein
VDGSGNIVLVNAQTELMFGHHYSEMLGKPVEMLLPERVRQVHAAHREGYVDEPRLRRMGENLPLYGRRKTGKEFPLEIMLSPVAPDTGLYTTAVARRRHEYVPANHASADDCP